MAVTTTAKASTPGRNGRIAFRRYFNAAQTWGAIYTINPNGTGLRQVTHPPKGILTSNPDWSANGRWIAYGRTRHGSTGCPCGIVLIHPNGTAKQDISDVACPTPDEPLEPDMCRGDLLPAWSPDGRFLAVTRFLGPPDNTTVATFVMQSDGTDVTQLTDPGDGFEDWAPTWSPDGTRLIYEHYDLSRNLTAIYTVRADGTDNRRVTRWSIDAGDNADWSPNGRWLLFISHTDDGGRKNFWIVHPNGTGYRRLTHFGTRFEYLSGSFAPNGRLITFGVLPGTGDAENADVYTMNLRGTVLRNVTGSVKWDSAADWGPRL